MIAPRKRLLSVGRAYKRRRLECIRPEPPWQRFARQKSARSDDASRR